MTDDLGSFALARLATSLYSAEDDRINDLFRSDRWLRRRVSDSARDWDGYESDLSLAFQSLLRSITTGTSALGDVVIQLVQLSLVRSTLASSENIPEAILLAAVRTGTWQSARATSTIGRYASREQQASVYISMLQADLDDAQRVTIQHALTDLAFTRPDQIPERDLIRGIPLLNEADQRVVADRLAAVCSIFPNGPHALAQSRGIGRGVLNATDVLPMMVTAPAARSPALVRKTINALIAEGARISREAEAEDGTQNEPLRSLDDVLRVDHAHIIYGDYVARSETLSSLVLAAEFLSVYPHPEVIPEKIAECLGCAASSEEWESLASAYAVGLEAVGIRWQPPEYRQANRYKSSTWNTDQDRLWWLRQFLIKSGHAADAHLRDDENVHSFLSFEDAQRGWVNRALALVHRPSSASREEQLGEAANPTERTLSREDDQPAEDLTGHEGNDAAGSEAQDLMTDTIMRAIAPVTAAWAVSLSSAPPEAVDELIPEVFDREHLMLQLFQLDYAAAEEQIDRTVAKRTKGGLLRYALEEAYRTGGLDSAWATVDDEFIAASDLSPVLEFVLSLPLEPERNYVTDLFASHEPDVRDVPLLAALEVVVNFLENTTAATVADRFLQIASTPIRNAGLNLLAPRLAKEAIERIVALDWKLVDAREQVWVLREIAAGCSAEAIDVKARIESMVVDAAEGIEDGWAYVDAILHASGSERFSAAAAVTNPQVLAAVRQMGTNDRTDALRGFSHHANRDKTVPPAVFDEIIKLPAINERCTYSWRGIALIYVAEFLDEEMAGCALESAMELPERFQDGSSQAWGRDWTNEFLRAGVVNALIPRLSPRDVIRTFEYAKTLPYLAREPIFRKLAEKADRELACLLFDQALEFFHTYMDLPDSELPLKVEEVVSMDSPEMFKMQRQIQTAELIALIIDRVDNTRMQVAANLAMRFTATGPCAWLGATVLNHLEDNHDSVDAELLTSMALVDAYSYIGSDPSRIDILIDLLPHVKHYSAARQVALEEFIASRFPDYGQQFLDQAHGERLDAADVRQYLHLTGIDRMPRPDNGSRSHGDVSEVTLRFQTATWILSPLAQSRRDRVIKELLLASPILSRLKALPRLVEVLPEDLCSTVLAESVQQLVEHARELDTETLAFVSRIIEQLPQASRSLFVRLVANLSPFDGENGGDLEEIAFDELYRDWGAMLRPHPKYDKHARSIAAQHLGDEIRKKQFQKAYGFMTPRVLFLSKLAQHLSQEDIKGTLQVIRFFPEVERAGALAALLPGADDKNTRLIIGEIHTIESRFARLWALFRSQAELREMEPSFQPMAEAIIGSFDTPTSVAAAALLMIGYLGEDRTFDVIVAQVDAAANDDSKLKLMSLAVRIGEGPERQARLRDILSKLSSPRSRYQGLLMFSRAGTELRDYLQRGPSDLLEAIYARLSEISLLPRSEFFRELAGEMSLLNALIDDADRLRLAQNIRQVCDQWRWP